MGRPFKLRTFYKNWDAVPLVLNTKETAGVLNCSTATVRNYIRLGELIAAKHGNKLFITKDNLKAFMNNKFAATAGGVSA